MAATLIPKNLLRCSLGLSSRSPSVWIQRNYCWLMGDPVEHATGLEKRELLAKQAGNDDPFDRKLIVKRSTGGKDKPTFIPSAFDARLVGCLCDPDGYAINWMWLPAGEPKRCECGFWFQLCEKAPV